MEGERGVGGERGVDGGWCIVLMEGERDEGVGLDRVAMSAVVTPLLPCCHSGLFFIIQLHF